jgi:hypothetical protein
MQHLKQALSFIVFLGMVMAMLMVEGVLTDNKMFLQVKWMTTVS